MTATTGRATRSWTPSLREGTLATWRWQGCGPRYTKFGHRILYRGADLNAWLDERMVNPTDRADEHARQRREFAESLT